MSLCRAPRRHLTQDASNPGCQVTTLPNKIRVATQSTPGHFSSVGLYVDAGSRFETPATSGASHFLDRMAFKTTSSRSSEEMATAVHSLGGQILCSSSRESIMYQSSHFHKGTPQALSLIADTALNSSFLHEEIEAQREAARRPMAPPPLASTSPPSVLKSTSRAASYLFPTSPPTASDSPALINAMRPTYTGGHRFIYDPSVRVQPPCTSHSRAPVSATKTSTRSRRCKSSSAAAAASPPAGPGKGMYSRLYTHILNHYPQVDHCASFHHIYTDSSLFGLFASAGAWATRPAQILPHLVHQLSLLLYTPIPAAELDRAKNQLKSALMMALESRAVEVEDLGRQILVHGRQVSITEMTAKIDLLKPADIRRGLERGLWARVGRQGDCGSAWGTRTPGSGRRRSRSIA
ncbi:peptidase family M16-domain-containing protein [Mycena polygramma]|nr:peptidase family M16-domain-containing protein [Mycena polygramma]